MAQKIRYNYDQMAAMAKQCREAAQKIEAHAANGNSRSQMMQGGAMVGPFGEAFVVVLGTYQQKCRKLAEAFMNQAAEIEKAISDMQSTDQGVSGNI